MPTLALTNFNIVVGVLGGWISLFGLVSYLLKENFYMSEALISLMAGVAFSPHAANFVRPLDYAGSEENLNAITLYFTRLVLGVQLVLAGVQLPSRYLKTKWKPLAILLGPIMTAMWLATSLLVWGLVPDLPFLHALVVGACVTPTDPVLSNVIVKGRFADHNIPKDLQKIIIAESGANDGLGYPFLFLALYLIKYIGDGGASESGGAGLAIGLWFGETWGYTIILSVVYGAAVGWMAKELLHFCEERKFVDRESFLVFAFSLALFITGTCGMIGSDDILACFIAGNVFTWDDWFRLETLDEPTIDMLLNVTIFMWYGVVCPWHSFVANGIIPIYRLIVLGILILLLRRLPFVLAVYKKIPQIDGFRQAIFMGFFGPIGCSAIFYLYVTLEFIVTLNPNDGDEPRSDVANLQEDVLVLVWFMVVCSVVVHGLSIPLGKFGFYLPRTISRSRSSPNMLISAQLSGRSLPLTRSRENTRVNTPTESRSASRSVSARPVFRIGGSIIPEPPATQPPTPGLSSANEAAGPGDNSNANLRSPDKELQSSNLPNRTIRFPDEAEADGKVGQEPERQDATES
ncbi:Sodium/hydrogen exchanger family-domain-containing protein [Hypoxylon rubiginosum]|uniref:Sodium/hydrogen exchanger family-domain-containing protein n=1 Tax=Hypoxylon rubiginosum TaxID=110542 RepID=A0ACC0DIX4_9PEZI|nr:Sodium/hydrogen exchanger family-domain-containing protein [Hypoxylon rubiginosum]